MILRVGLGVMAGFALLVSGCELSPVPLPSPPESPPRVVSVPGKLTVYTALDREFSAPILQAYEQQTGILVLPKFDVESTKTVGLTNLIIVEAVRPR